jgi:hypothetical protein
MTSLVLDMCVPRYWRLMIVIWGSEKKRLLPAFVVGLVVLLLATARTLAEILTMKLSK